MSTKRKMASVVLATFLSATMVLTACGSNKGNEPAAGNEGADSSKPYEITMAVLQTGNSTDLPAVQEEINKITKEKINATVKIVPISFGAWSQQTNLMLAGSEKLDLIVSSSFFNFSGQVAKGQLLPLDELMAEYGQGITEAVGEDYLNATKIDGKIYGVTALADEAGDYGIIMRKDLVDKYNIDTTAIKSWTDLEPIFQTIKDNEPGVSPLVQQTQTSTLAYIMTAAIYDSLGDSFGVTKMDDSSAKVVNLFETAEYKEAVDRARKWYEAGYVMKDVATTQETGVNLMKAGTAFSYLTVMKPGLESQESTASGREVVGVRLTPPVTMSASANGFMLSITKNSENPERTMQLMNLLYTDKDIVNLLDNGIEGKHYTVNSDGTIKGVADSSYLFNEWQVGNNFLSAVWEGNDPSYWEEMKAFNKSSIISPAFGFTYDADKVKTEVAAVSNVANQYRVGLESGTLDSNKNLDDFNKKLKAAGLDKIIAEKQAQLDEWKAQQGK